MADIAKINGLNLKDAAARESLKSCIKALSVSGRTITYTKTDGTTGTITTQDTNTTYNVVTSTINGLMSAVDKNTFDTMKDQMKSALRVASNSTTASNGYMNLTNTSGTRLQLRWGYATPASGGKITVNFASSFSSTCLAVVGAALGSSSDNTICFKVYSKSATGFTAYVTYVSSGGGIGMAGEQHCWFAIGY